MADSSNIPSWAVPAKAAAPVAPKTQQKAPKQGGLGGLVQGAVSGVENFVGGLLKPKAAATPAPTPTPSWAVPAGGTSKTPAKTSTTAPISNTGDPSWAVTPQKKTPSGMVLKNGNPLGNLMKPTVDAGPVDSSTSQTNGADQGLGSGFVAKTDSAESPYKQYETTGSAVKDVVKNFVTSVPAATWQVFRSLGQGIVKSAAEVGVNLAQDINTVEAKLGDKKAKDLAPYMTGTITANPGQETKRWQRAYGATTIDSLSNQVADLEQTIKNSPFAKRIGADKYALPLAFGGIVGGETLNFAPIGGEESAVDQLAKAATDAEAGAVLRSIGLDEKIVTQLSPEFAKMTDKAEIKEALTTAQALHATAHPTAQDGMQELSHVVSTAEEKPVPKTVEEFNALDPAAQEEMFNKMPRKLVDKILGVETPVDTLVESILSGQKKLSVGAEIKSEKLTSLGRGNYARIFRKGGTAEKLDEAAQSVGITADELLQHLEEGIAERKQSKIDAINKSQGETNLSGGVPVSARTRPDGLGFKTPNPEHNLDQNNIFDPAKPKPAEPSVVDIQKQKVLERLRQHREAQVHASMSGVPFSMKSAAQAARESLISKITKNEQDRADIFKTNHVPEAKVGDEDQAHGLYQTEEGDITSGPFKGWSTHVAELFQYGFANKRKGDTIEAAGAVMRKRFESLREHGIDGILQFEGFARGEDGRITAIEGGPNRTGIFEDIGKANDDMFIKDREAGVQQGGKPIQYKKNYLRVYIKDPAGNIYDGKGSLVAARGGRSIARTASFAIPREFETNAEAVEAGYQLAFPNVPDLMAARAMEDQKAVADATLFNEGVRNGLVIPVPALSDNKALSSGFKMYDPDRFPKYKTRYVDRQTGITKEYVGPYYGPEKFVDKVNSFLFDPKNGDSMQRFMAGAAKFVGTTKNIALSVGIPNLRRLAAPVIGESAASHIPQLFSGFSLHFWNLLPRATLAEKAPVDYFRYAIDPSAAAKFVQENVETAFHFAQQGLTLSTEEHENAAFDLKSLKTMAGVSKNANAAARWLHGVFGEGLFGKVMPAMKLKGAMARTEQYVGQGIPRQEAERMAADVENTIWGGTNLDALGRNKNWQNFFRAVLIAPDYAETNIKMGIKMAQSTYKWHDPSLAPYRNFMAAFAIAYGVMNFAQYEHDGSFSVQNDPLHIFSLKWGKDGNGKTRYINPMGTGVDMLRIPGQIISSIIHNKPNDIVSVITNRMSIPAKFVAEMLENNNWAGQAIYGTDHYGNPIPASTAAGNVLNESVGATLPGSTQTLLSALQGKFSPEQAALQGLALPVGYVNEQPNMTTIKALEADAKLGIQSGDYTLYQELVRAGVIAPRSRATFIRDALTAGGKTARQLQTSAKAKARLQKEEKALQAEGITKNSQ